MSTSPGGRRWLSIKQAAELLSCHIASVRRLVQRGKLRVYRPGGLRRILFDRAEVEACVVRAYTRRQEGE